MREQEHQRHGSKDLALRNSSLQCVQENRQRQPAHLQIALLDQPVVRPNMINFQQYIEVPLSCLNTDPSLNCGTISASHLKSTSSAKYLLMATNTTRSGSPHKCPSFH